MDKGVHRLLYITAILLMVFLITWFFNLGETSLTHIKYGDSFHLVRDMPDKEEAAELMDEIKERLQMLVDYTSTNSTAERGMLLKNRFKEQNIQETDVNDGGTSYSIDKGKEIHLCLRDKKTSRLHNINILMFVSIHELAHVMSESYGHNGEFGDNFVYLLKQAVKLGIWQNIDYSKNPEEFCGMKVDSNPLKT